MNNTGGVSFLKLIIDKTTIQKYDLIVIDEVESILRQFSSPTFKGAAPTSFHLLVNLLKHPSTKLISLDGDLNERGFEFVKHVGKSYNIINKNEFIIKTLNIMNQKEDFESKIMLELENNLKLVIPTMSATYGSELLDKLQTKYPEKRIMYY